MEKIDNTINSFNHGITLSERKTLFITGVKKIENFDEEEFVMETTMNTLIVKGSTLELIKLDTIQGNVSIKGKIDSITYLDDVKTKDNQGIFHRIFK